MTASRPASAEALLGSRSALAREGVRALYESLVDRSCAAARSGFEIWKTAFSQATGRDLDASSPAAGRLARAYAAPAGARPAELLYCVQTYYAMVLRIAAAERVGNGALSHSLADADRRARLGAWRSIEQQQVFRQAGVLNLLDDDCFGWTSRAWSAPIDRLVRGIAECIPEWIAPAARDSNGFGSSGWRRFDLATKIHPAVFPAAVRRPLGEFYTPRWLVNHLLDALEYPGPPQARLLDPTCGSGAFLLAAIARLRQRQGAGGDLAAILAGVAGIDLHPLAVLAARTNYLLAIADLLDQAPHGGLEIPVYCGDAILGPAGLQPPFDRGPARELLGEVDFLAGNPPWIGWDHLPPTTRAATRPLWERYGLFTLSAKDARHGGGKKDLSALLLYAAADQFLKPGGKLGFVITQTLFQSKGAGDGFRRFRLGQDGPPLEVLRVDDLANVQVFDGASNWTGAVVIRKGRPTRYPVPYYRWSLAPSAPRGGDGQPAEDESDDIPSGISIERCLAAPVDASAETSPWFASPAALAIDLASLAGPSDYRAHLGANAAGASDVYWLRIVGDQGGVLTVRNLDAGKRKAAGVECQLEPDLLYPLLRWGDITRWRATPQAHLLLVQDAAARTGIDEAELARRLPKTYAYLQRFRTLLESRAAWKRYQQAGPFYSMYNVGDYTLSPIKVVWRRMDRRINAAVAASIDDPHLGVRCLIPQETCVLAVAQTLDEAHYLCAMLNSVCANFLAIAQSVRGGKGFGAPGLLQSLRIARYQPGDELHRRLATASLEAHQKVAAGESPAEQEREIDQAAAAVWGVSRSDLAIMERTIAGGSPRRAARR